MYNVINCMDSRAWIKCGVVDVLVLLFVLVVFVVFSFSTAAQNSSGYRQNRDNPPYKMGEILIQYDKSLFRARTDEIENSGLLGNTNTSTSIAPVSVANEFLTNHGIENPHVITRIESLNTELIHIGENTDPLAIISQLKANPVEGILSAQPNFIYTATQSTPTTGLDPQRNASWHLKAIQLKDAWDFASYNAHPDADTVVVGVLDDGIDFSDKDLDSVKWNPTSCKDENGNVVSEGCPHGGYDMHGSSHDNDPSPIAGNTHGTSVSSVAAAEYNNLYGVIGVAQNVNIAGIRIVENQITSSVDIIEGINFAQENDIDIINLSFSINVYTGTGCQNLMYGRDGNLSSIWLIYQALSQYEGLAVISVGNVHKHSGGNNHTGTIPADYAHTIQVGGKQCWVGLDNVISVGGTELNSEGVEEIWVKEGIEGGGTAYGNHIDISAPADLIQTVDGVRDGTSYSSPQVVGTAAIMLQINPFLTPEDIKERIKNSADTLQNLVNSNLSGGRRLNAYRAARVALNPDDPFLKTPRIVPTIQNNQDPLITMVPAFIPKNVAAVSGDRSLTVSWDTVPNATNYEIRWRAAGRDTTLTPWEDVGSSTTKTLTNLLNNTVYVVHVRAKNNIGTSRHATVGFSKETTPIASTAFTPKNVVSIPGDRNLTVSWNSVPDATSYEIRWRAAGRDTTLTLWEDIGNTTAKTITNLINNTVYVVHVRAKNDTSTGRHATVGFNKSTTPITPSL